MLYQFAQIFFIIFCFNMTYTHITKIDEYLRRFNFKRILTTITIHKWCDDMYILKDLKGIL